MFSNGHESAGTQRILKIVRGSTGMLFPGVMETLFCSVSFLCLKLCIPVETI